MFVEHFVRQLIACRRGGAFRWNAGALEGIAQHAALVSAVGQLVTTEDRTGVAVRALHRLPLLREVGLRLQVIVLEFISVDLCMCEFLLTARTAKHPTWHVITPGADGLGKPASIHLRAIF